VNQDFVITHRLGSRVPHIPIEVRVGIAIADRDLTRKAGRDPIVADKTLALNNAIVQHELPKRRSVARGDFEVSLTCRPIDRNMPPSEILNIQRLVRAKSSKGDFAAFSMIAPVRNAFTEQYRYFSPGARFIGMA